MPSYQTPALDRLLAKAPSFQPVIAHDLTAIDTPELISTYDRIFPLLERLMWQSPQSAFDQWLDLYQALFREQQALIDRSRHGFQYRFLIGIPVADRPSHLRSCLDSIYQLCRLYGYGGKRDDGCYDKVTVVVADDSRERCNIERHQAIIEEYCQIGLQVIHFGQSEQYQLLQAIPEHHRQHLGRLLTTQTAEHFFLKGQAANRNLAYLKFLDLTHDKQRTLYYLVDCDQSFLVNHPAQPGGQPVSALNYFYYINRIFQTTDTRMLTGKLVGDPPVSPAVMAANFIGDVAVFLEQISQYSPMETCRFHNQDAAFLPGDAAYHDMAELFGFEQKIQSFAYRCPITTEHDNAACLTHFTDRLSAFFFGEHLTRKTNFHYTGSFTQLAPARTIYPGNYIVNYDGLKYVIPFGHLRLRMSGPTAGRLVQAEIGDRFASVNLPMLHRRTAGPEMLDDFRPGVQRKDHAAIDISDEFERQFFGDLMLFSVTEWLRHHDLSDMHDSQGLQAVVDHVEAELLRLYQSKHAAVNTALAKLERWVRDEQHWWDATAAMDRILQFLRNIELNFGDDSQAWRQLQSVSHRRARKQQIIDALTSYRSERDAWDRLFLAQR